MGNLSVFIPTFNRPKAIVDQVGRFLPQLGTTTLTVIDNASETGVRDLLPSPVRCVRNAVNIGATANVLRCFELCETDWIYICGDDDPILDDALARAHEIIHQFSDTCFVSTSSRLVTHRENRRVSNISQLLAQVEDIGRLFWLSGNLYNVKQLRPYLRIANYLPNAAPQMVLVLMAMSQGLPAGVSTSRIALNTYPEDPSQRWNEYEVLCYLSGLVDLPIPLVQRKAVAASLAETILSFNEHFLRVLNAVAADMPAAEDMIALFGSRFSRLFVVLDDMEKLKFLVARLELLRDRDESRRILHELGAPGVRSVEIPARFQRL